jgi:osmotically-inducible protein OsmY
MELRPTTEIADRVTEALLNDKRTHHAAIDVVSNQGGAGGALDSEATRQAAQESARQHSGVITVVSELVII